MTAVLLSPAGVFAQAQQTPTLSLQAVKKNGAVISPTNSLSAVPGDTIECHVLVSEWSTAGQRLESIQFAIDSAGFSSGGCGTVGLIEQPRPCSTDPQCADAGVACVSGFCDTDEPIAGSFLTNPACPFVFCGTGHLCVSDFAVPRLGCVIVNGTRPRYGTAPGDTSVPAYVATIKLLVSGDAAGRFTIPFLPPPNSFLLDESNQAILPLRLEPLTIDVGACENLEPIASSPPNCAIDARQPSEPDGTSASGWSSIDLTFGFPISEPLGPGDFSIREVPPSATPIEIDSVTTNAGGDPNAARLDLSRRISLRSWTCVRRTAGAREFCIAHLPSDVNGDRTANLSDVTRLLDCLRGTVICVPVQCDMDRSARCTPEDLLRVADLLNGAQIYEPSLNASLPACPSGP